MERTPLLTVSLCYSVTHGKFWAKMSPPNLYQLSYVTSVIHTTHTKHTYVHMYIHTVPIQNDVVEAHW